MAVGHAILPSEAASTQHQCRRRLVVKEVQAREVFNSNSLLLGQAVNSIA